LIKNVIFDIGRVLLEFQPKQYLIKKFKDEDLAETLHSAVFGSSEWLDLDKGILTDEEAVEIFSKRHSTHKAHIKQIMEDWHTLLLPIEGTVKILESLKHKGYRIILLSNFHLRAFERVYAQYPFFKLADDMVISSRIKMLKPHKQIYEYMLSSLKLIPDECLFIDDTAANVKGAGELGINTIQFTSPEQLEKELIELGLY
jgi:epoxide hydrolase-like predicted phosphatase